MSLSINLQKILLWREKKKKKKSKLDIALKNNYSLSLKQRLNEAKKHFTLI